MRWWLPVAVALVIAATPRAAEACSFATWFPFEEDPSLVGVDTTPPATPSATFEVSRFEDSGLCTHNSCEGLAALLIRFEGLADDMTAVADLGFEVRVAEGNPPPSLTFETGTFIISSGTAVPYDADDPLDFTLAIRIVDKAGNASDDVLLHVTDPGPSGCSVTGARAADLAPLALALAFFAATRRRGRRGRPPTASRSGTARLGW